MKKFLDAILSPWYTPNNRVQDMMFHIRDATVRDLSTTLVRADPALQPIADSMISTLEAVKFNESMINL